MQSQLLKCSDSGQKSELARIEVFVFLTFLLFLSLFPVAILRRWRKSTALKVYAWLANAAVLSMIPYTLGLMRNLGHKSDLVSIWAVFFMYVYVNVPNVVNFNDSMSIGVAYVKLLLYAYYATVILYTSLGRNRCPFKVIEVELELLHDYIYNSSCFFLYTVSLSWILAIHLMRLVLIIWTGVSTLIWCQPKGKTRVGVDVLLTWMVVIASIVLELVQLIEFLSSSWQKMPLVCTYFARKSWENQNVWDRCIRKATEKVFSPKRGGELNFKPWRQLGQYSLLDTTYSYLQRFRGPLIILNVMTGNRFVRPGRNKSKSVSLTTEIKEAVVNTLLDRGPQLTNGLSTLKASDQYSPETKSKLVWACTQVHTKAQVILIWHIAMSLCELKQEGSPRDGGDFNVATSLSKYCAYLVAFVPDMLPSNVANSNYTCSMVIDEAYSCLMRCEASSIYDELMKIVAEDDDPSSKRGASNILKQGAVLGKVLVEQVEDPKARWKVLAGFWAEMILYLAPNNEWAHVEQLADGGEFITHLWALLFHAGFVDRDSLSNHPARDAADANHPSELGQVR